MAKFTATAGEIIAALMKLPADTPVFGYSEYDEQDSVIEVCEVCEGYEKEIDEDDGPEYKCIPHYCKGDSFVERHWEENGEGTVVYLRERGWREDETKPTITIFGKEGE